MKVSAKARYAVMAMVDLANFGGEISSSPLTAISERQNLPLPYLEQLFLKLRRAKLVRSSRGSYGGYVLEKAAKETYIYDIISAVEPPLKATRCKNESVGCQTEGAKCLTHSLWKGLETVVENYLKQISLEDVLHKKLSLGKNITDVINEINEDVEGKTGKEFTDGLIVWQ